MNKIKQLACETFLQFKGDLSVSSIKTYLETLDWEFISLRESAGCMELLNSLNFPEGYPKNKDAFTYLGEGMKLIFMRPEYHEEDKKIFLCHELGHILLGHPMEKGIQKRSDATLEDEANTFSFYLRNITIADRIQYRLNKKPIRTAFICCLIFALLSLAGMLLLSGSKESPGGSPLLSDSVPTAGAAVPSPFSTEAAASAHVFITAKSAAVYHTFRDCSYIREKPEEEIDAIDISEAGRRGLELCQRCAARK